MKANIVFSILFIYSAFCFGQNPTTLVVKELWDEEQEIWVVEDQESWKYNSKRQETNYLKQHFDHSGFGSDSEIEVISEYDERGNVVLERTISSYGNSSSEKLIESQFNESNQVTAIINQKFNANGELIEITKTEYEYGASDDWISKKDFEKLDANSDWELSFEINKIFDSEGCFLNIEYIDYETYLNRTSILTGSYKRHGACLVDTFVLRYTPAVDSLPMSLRQRDVYQYPEENLNYIKITERWDPETDEVKEFYHQEEDFDEEGRSIRYYRNYVDAQDSILITRSYTTEGLPFVINEVNTSDTYGSPTPRVKKDSFEYIFEQDLLLNEYNFRFDSYFYQYEKNTAYEYDCDGQLKSETVTYSDQFPNSRTRYEYLVEVDCNLSQQNASITIFPNPTSGKLYLLSNVLDVQDAKYELYSITGQLMRSGEFPQSFTPTEIELGAAFGNGYYVLRLFTEDIVVAEKFVLLH